MDTQMMRVEMGNSILDRLMSTLPIQYKTPAREFIAHLQEKGKELSAETFVEFIERKREIGYTDRSGVHRDYKAEGLNAYIFAVKKLIRSLLDLSSDMPYAQRTPLLHWLDHIKPVKIAKEQKQVGKEKVLSPEEVRNLIPGSGERDGLIFEFLALSGCRISEALGIKLSMLSPVNGYYEIALIGKGRKERTVRVPAELVNRIRAVFKGEVYLFETKNGKPLAREYAYQRMRKHGQQILGKRVYLHMLRHTFASNMVKMYPEDLAGISAYLGHAKVSTTADMYVHGKLSYAKLNGYYAKFRRDNEHQIDCDSGSKND
jgi:integrase